MCVEGCLETVHRRLSRRGFFAGVGAAAIGGGASAVARAAPVSFTEVVDMSHPLSAKFPTYMGDAGIEMERLAEIGSDGYNMKRWHVVEHSGTHLDAPIHFSEAGQTMSEVPVDHLVAPLAVIDIQERAERDPDAVVRPEDIKAWEKQHGPIPDGAAVAMHSGWASRVRGEGFRNADEEGVMHFPGFHPDAAKYLMETGAVGLAVDTLSLDPGPSEDFETHYAWLPSNRWGLECVRNLDRVPPRGATLVVGAPKVEGATGGPTRVLALR